MSHDTNAFVNLFEVVHSDHESGTIYINPTSREIKEAYTYAQETDGYMRGTMLCNLIKGSWCLTNMDDTHETLARKVNWNYGDCASFYIYPATKDLSYSHCEYAVQRGGSRLFDPILFENNEYLKQLISSGWSLKNTDVRPKISDEKTKERSQRALDTILQSDRRLLDKLMGEDFVTRFCHLFEAHSYDGWEGAISGNPMLAAGADLCGEIENLGGEALIVGGVVRDLLLGKSVADVDIATNVDLATIEGNFDTHDIGKSKDFGIVTIRYGGFDFEVANYRSESGYSDGRRPDSVTIEQGFEADSARRDLTINAMGIDRHGVIHDYHGGADHLMNKLIQTVGDPNERFSEDALRLLRAARFAAKLGFEIAPETHEAMSKLGHMLDGLAPERIRDELFKTAKSGGSVLADYLEHLDSTGLLDRFLPEVTAMKGLEHNPEHHPEGGVWEHVLACVRSSTSTNPVHNLAILFHDLGKVTHRGYHDDGRVHYHGHEAGGVPIFLNIAKRLKFTNSDRDAIVHAVEHHMLGHKIGDLTDKSILKLRQSPHWDTFKTVVKADAQSRLHLWDEKKFQADMDKAEAVFKKYGDKAEFEARMSALIDGKMVMELTGAEGAEIGRIKNFVRDEIIARGFNVTPEEVKNMILSA
jgi:tRNA nucleotidyltransferase/poly(A) polymerase